MKARNPFLLVSLGLVVLVLFSVFAIPFSIHALSSPAHAADLALLLPLFGMAAAPVVPQGAGAGQSAVSALLSRITRDQRPEFEQTLSWVNTSQLSTPTSLRTDRKIKFLQYHVRGRITNGAGAVSYRSGPSLLGTPLFSLLQQITIRGQHFRYGAQSPFQMRGETAAEYMAIMYPNWTPQFSVSVNGGALTPGQALSGVAAATNDFDFSLPIPLFPPDVSSADQVFYCLHGPDWAGNLYTDVQTADVTALGATLAQIANGGTVTAFGSATGSGSIDILSERPLVTKQYMAKIKPALCFRITNFQQPSAAVQTVAGSGIKLADLTVGKDTTRIFLKVGVAQAATTGGVVAYASLSDSIITRTTFAMDNRVLSFGNANSDLALKDYMGRQYGRSIPAGYRVIDFISGSGNAPANVKGSFASSKLTAARKFEVDADISAVAANQIAEVVQEMTLGRPQLLG